MIMSYQIQARIICDRCGGFLESPVEKRKKEAECMVRTLKVNATKAGWLTLPRRYGTERHFCKGCADKA